MTTDHENRPRSPRRKLRALRASIGRLRTGRADIRRRLDRLEKLRAIAERQAGEACDPASRPPPADAAPPDGRRPLSREARQLLVRLCCIANREGCSIAMPRYLDALFNAGAGDLAPAIGGWLDELEAEGCIVRYTVGDIAYLCIVHWHPPPADRPMVRH